jgi:hypothetical protein
MVMQTNPSHAATEDTAAARYEVIRRFYVIFWLPSECQRGWYFWRVR